MCPFGGLTAPEGCHIPLTCDRFPPTVQLWPWTPGHPMVPRRSPDEYCFPGRRAQLIRQKDHAAAPRHPTIGCLFWGSKSWVPLILGGKGVIWAGGQIFQGFCNRIILCDVAVNGSNRLQILQAFDKVKNSSFHYGKKSLSLYILHNHFDQWIFSKFLYDMFFLFNFFLFLIHLFVVTPTNEIKMLKSVEHNVLLN